MDHINQFDDHGFTPLLYAIRDSNFDQVQMLIRQGADVNQPSQTHQWVPIHLALQVWIDNLDNQNAVNVFVYLMEHGDTDVNAVDVNGDTLLLKTLGRPHTDHIIDFILQHPRTNVNMANQNHKTPLMMAMYSSDIVYSLIHKGADINSEMAPANTTAVELLFEVQIDSAYKQHVTIPILELLIQSPYQTLNINANTLRSILDAENIYPPILEYILYFQTANIDFGPAQDGVDPVCYSAIIGDLDAMITLTSYLQYDLQQVMTCSVQAETPEIMQYLMARGVDFNVTDALGAPALKYALVAQSYPCIDMLLATNTGLVAGNRRAHGSLMKALVKLEDMTLIKKIDAAVPTIHLMKPIYVSDHQREMSPLEYYVHAQPDGTPEAIAFIGEYMLYAAPRYGFAGFRLKLPDWFRNNRDLMAIYNQYDKLYYRCILNTNTDLYQHVCRRYAMPHVEP